MQKKQKINNMDNRYNEVFLYFEEKEHKYNDSFGNAYKSVTTFLHNYKPSFDKTYWLRKKARELGISEKQLATQWQNITDEACGRGTKTHNYLEDGIKDVSMFNKAVKYLTDIHDGRMITVADIYKLNVKPLDIDKFIEATDNKYPKIYEVFKYYTDRGYTIYSEIGAFLIDYLISGTIDILAIREDQFVILDWKTNRGGLLFESGYFKKDKNTTPHQLTNEWIKKDDRLLAPISHLEDCNGNIYSLQLSLYALMVELILNIPCAGLGLCHIGSPFVLNQYGQPYRDYNNQYPIDENGIETVKWFPIKYFKKECVSLLNDRKKEISANVNSQYELGI